MSFIVIDYTKPKPDRGNQNNKPKGKPHHKGGKKGNKNNSNDQNNPAHDRSNNETKAVTRDKKISKASYMEYAFELSNLWLIFTFRIMKKSQSLVEEEKTTKHKPSGKGGKSGFGATQYAKFKNKSAVDDHTSLQYKHKRNGSGADNNLMQYFCDMSSNMFILGMSEKERVGNTIRSSIKIIMEMLVVKINKHKLQASYYILLRTTIQPAHL